MCTKDQNAYTKPYCNASIKKYQEILKFNISIIFEKYETTVQKSLL